MIEADRLSKIYGSSPAIEDVTFAVEAGEILGFLGPNGAGKTTTMRILTGYLPATSGTARIAGFDVHEDSMAVRQRIGYLPETPPLYPEMSVEGFLHFVAQIKGISAGDRRDRINTVLGQCGLTDKRRVTIRKLSKGFRQRVGIAQAIVHNPPVIILDEPTVGLDPRQIIEVRKLIESLAGDHTIILCSHILPEVSMTCTRVAIISGGRVVAIDRPDALMDRLTGGLEYDLEVAAIEGDLVLDTAVAIVLPEPPSPTAGESGTDTETDTGAESTDTQSTQPRSAELEKPESTESESTKPESSASTKSSASTASESTESESTESESSASTDLASTDLASTDSESTASESTESESTESESSASTDLASTDLASTDSASAESASAESASTESASSASTDLASTESASTESASSASTDLASTDSASTESESVAPETIPAESSTFESSVSESPVSEFSVSESAQPVESEPAPTETTDPFTSSVMESSLTREPRLSDRAEALLTTLALIPGISRVEPLLDRTQANLHPDRLQVRLAASGPGEPGGAIAAAVVAAGLNLCEMRRRRASLEDVFLTLTTQDTAWTPDPATPEIATSEPVTPEPVTPDTVPPDSGT